MPRVIEGPAVEPVVRALLGATAVDGGCTAEQRGVIDALVTGYWGRDDLVLDELEPLDVAGAAAAITKPAHRHRLRQLMVLLEFCRHPLSAAQAQLVDEYADAVGEAGAGYGLTMARDLVRDGAGAASADYLRFFGTQSTGLAEVSLRSAYATNPSRPDPELAARLAAFGALAEGTLGHAFVEFYRRNDLTLPGEDPSMPAVFVSHDMCHVIGGYGPTGAEEIALGAMQLAMNDNEMHWVQFLGNLAVHEARFMTAEGPEHGMPALAGAGGAALLAEGLSRGAACTGDFTAADHLGMADLPLEEVRARFGVPPRLGSTAAASV